MKLSKDDLQSGITAILETELVENFLNNWDCMCDVDGLLNDYFIGEFDLPISANDDEELKTQITDAITDAMNEIADLVCKKFGI